VNGYRTLLEHSRFSWYCWQDRVFYGEYVADTLAACLHLESESNMIEIGVGGILCFLPIFLIGLATTVFWIWMLVDCLTKESSEGNDKLVWAAVIFFLHLLGAVLYYFVRRPKRIEELGQ